MGLLNKIFSALTHKEEEVDWYDEDDELDYEQVYGYQSNGSYSEYGPDFDEWYEEIYRDDEEEDDE